MMSDDNESPALDLDMLDVKFRAWCDEDGVFGCSKFTTPAAREWVMAMMVAAPALLAELRQARSVVAAAKVIVDAWPRCQWGEGQCKELSMLTPNDRPGLRVLCEKHGPGPELPYSKALRALDAALAGGGT